MAFAFVLAVQPGAMAAPRHRPATASMHDAMAPAHQTASHTQHHNPCKGANTCHGALDCYGMAAIVGAYPAVTAAAVRVRAFGFHPPLSGLTVPPADPPPIA